MIQRQKFGHMEVRIIQIELGNMTPLFPEILLLLSD